MGFRNFRLNVAVRVLLLGGLVLTSAWSVTNTPWEVTPVAAGVLALLVVIDLIRYVESVSRDLTGFLTFVAHDDFSGVPAGRKGKVFRDLEAAYRLLTERFRKLNLRRAADHRYLELLVEHVNVALVCFDSSGAVTLMNRQAKSLFKTPHLASLKSFARIDPKLPVLIGELGDGGRALIGLKVADEDLQLALYLTEFELLGGRYKIISFQNIRDELEQGEIDYAQRLIKVLRHEIMNSVTPITSLTQLLEERLVDRDSGCVSIKELSDEEQRDLARSLASIQSRGRGLMRFVQAYGQLANLPRPNFTDVDVHALFDRVHALMAPAFEAGVEFAIDAADDSLNVWADPHQIEQVLINLLKNAYEALKGRSDGRVLLRGARSDRGKVLIQVIDNGPGIDASQSEEVFLPFFTTKRNGTGVGLSVSRQIMLLHKGALKLKSSAGRGTEFTLRFR